MLYANIFAKLFRVKGFTELSPDHNPGTVNAFKYGGFWCGSLTLIGDLQKGAVPVLLYRSYIGLEPTEGLPFALIMAAPVLGHAFPLLNHFRGGKGIAVSFGCLLGLLPIWQPLAVLAAYFIFFSTAIIITSHYHRTFITYLCALASMFFVVDSPAVCGGFAIISAVVILRLLISRENKEQLEVKLLWTR